jgi:hypothetical protein
MPFGQSKVVFHFLVQNWQDINKKINQLILSIDGQKMQEKKWVNLKMRTKKD